MFTLTTPFSGYVSQKRLVKKEDREIKVSGGLLTLLKIFLNVITPVNKLEHDGA